MTSRVHNTAQTLLDLGFVRWPAWDYARNGPLALTEHYRLETPHGTFRAYEERHNGPLYVRLGKVTNEQGHVELWGWQDCVSAGSVARKIAPPS